MNNTEGASISHGLVILFVRYILRGIQVKSY
jgi:hypothetical protein